MIPKFGGLRSRGYPDSDIPKNVPFTFVINTLIPSYPGDIGHIVIDIVCVLLLQDLLQSCSRGGGEESGYWFGVRNLGSWWAS